MLQDAFLDKHGVKLGFMSAFVKAAADALQVLADRPRLWHMTTSFPAYCAMWVSARVAALLPAHSPTDCMPANWPSRLIVCTTTGELTAVRFLCMAGRTSGERRDRWH